LVVFSFSIFRIHVFFLTYLHVFGGIAERLKLNSTRFSISILSI
jgi:hypothetical protein